MQQTKIKMRGFMVLRSDRGSALVGRGHRGGLPQGSLYESRAEEGPTSFMLAVLLFPPPSPQLADATAIKRRTFARVHLSGIVPFSEAPCAPRSTMRAAPCAHTMRAPCAHLAESLFLCLGCRQKGPVALPLLCEVALQSLALQGERAAAYAPEVAALLQDDHAEALPHLARSMSQCSTSLLCCVTAASVVALAVNRVRRAGSWACGVWERVP